jgi:thiamine kinase-like enzyme
MPATLQRLEAFLLELRSPVVLCHNDLQEGNVMWDGNPQQQVQLIDFEYCSSGYRGFDIGNHFCEWAVVNNCPESQAGAADGGIHCGL